MAMESFPQHRLSAHVARINYLCDVERQGTCMLQHFQMTDEDIDAAKNLLSKLPIHPFIHVEFWEKMQLLSELTAVSLVGWLSTHHRECKDNCLMERVLLTGGVPLHCAVSVCGYLGVVHLLMLRCPLALEQTDSNGMTPLHLAFLFTENSLLHSYVLQAHPGAAAVQDVMGYTPAHLAARFNRHADMRELVAVCPIAACLRTAEREICPKWHAATMPGVVAEASHPSFFHLREASLLHLVLHASSNEDTVQCVLDAFPGAVLFYDKAAEMPLNIAISLRAPNGVKRALLKTIKDHDYGACLVIPDNECHIALEIAVRCEAQCEEITMLLDATSAAVSLFHARIYKSCCSSSKSVFPGGLDFQVVHAEGHGYSMVMGGTSTSKAFTTRDGRTGHDIVWVEVQDKIETLRSVTEIAAVIDFRGPYMRDERVRNMLRECVQNLNPDIGSLSALLESFQRHDSRFCEKGLSLLHIAAACKASADVMKLLIDKKCGRPEAIDVVGYTALQYLSWTRETSLLTPSVLFPAHPGDAFRRVAPGGYPAQSRSYPDEKSMRVLLRECGPVNFPVSNTHYSALELVVSTETDVGVVQMVYDACPNAVERRGPGGNLPIHRAVAREISTKNDTSHSIPKDPSYYVRTSEARSSTVHFLLKKYREGATITNGHNDLPLHVAARLQAEPRIVQALLKAYPEGMRIVDEAGNTPLHLAVIPTAMLFPTCVQTIRIMLKTHSAVQILDGNGDSVLAVWVRSAISLTVLSHLSIYSLHPSMEAVGRNQREVLRMLVAAWPEAIFQESKRGVYPLQYLVKALRFYSTASSIDALVVCTEQVVLVLNELWSEMEKHPKFSDVASSSCAVIAVEVEDICSCMLEPPPCLSVLIETVKAKGVYFMCLRDDARASSSAFCTLLQAEAEVDVLEAPRLGRQTARRRGGGTEAKKIARSQAALQEIQDAEALKRLQKANKKMNAEKGKQQRARHGYQAHHPAAPQRVDLKSAGDTALPQSKNAYSDVPTQLENAHTDSLSSQLLQLSACNTALEKKLSSSQFRLSNKTANNAALEQDNTDLQNKNQQLLGRLDDLLREKSEMEQKNLQLGSDMARLLVGARYGEIF